MYSVLVVPGHSPVRKYALPTSARMAPYLQGDAHTARQLKLVQHQMLLACGCANEQNLWWPAACAVTRDKLCS
jgi:hypothetical protein